MDANLNQVFTWLTVVEKMALEYTPKIIGALVLYLVGKWFIQRAASVFKLLFEKQHIDPSLKTFFVSFIRIGLFVLLLLAIIGLVGIPIAGFAAIIAGLAFGVGSALNGSLGNVAGGILILLTRPFRIGDLISAENQFGIVQEIGIIHTTILTAQNHTVHLPNGALSTGIIANYSQEPNLRIDLTIPVVDGTDVARARAIAVAAMRTHPNVLADPAPDVQIKALTTDGMQLVLWPRIRVKPYDLEHPRQMQADYYSVYFGVQELVKTAFQKAGIGNSVNSMEVTMVPPAGDSRT